MIIIFSVPNDSSTLKVIRWLLRYNFQNFKILNPLNIKDINFQISDNKVSFFLEGIAIESINVVWYRRQGMSIPEKILQLPNGYNLSFYTNLREEAKGLSNYTFKQLSDKFWLNNPQSSRISKLLQLSEAQKNGIKIPETLITTSKEKLINFFELHKSCIIKPIAETFSLFDKNGSGFDGFTKRIDIDFVNNLPKTLNPSFIQEEIVKKFEIRVFFLENQFYSMAIFSPKNSNENIDVRSVGSERNRQVPFCLPTEIENKLKLLLKNLGLNSGSIDLAYTFKNEFVFFEVNPVGQFGMVSLPCNYHLEKKIAELLIMKNNESNRS